MHMETCKGLGILPKYPKLIPNIVTSNIWYQSTERVPHEQIRAMTGEEFHISVRCLWLKLAFIFGYNRFKGLGMPCKQDIQEKQPLINLQMNEIRN